MAQATTSGTTLVTGAGGFIGCHVVRELLARGDRVRALLHPKESDQSLMDIPEVQGRLEVVRGDILDEAALPALFADVTRLYHLAAIYSVARRDLQRIYEVNVVGSQRVLAQALRSGVERVVYTSSIAAVGNRDGWRLDDVDSLPNEETAWNRAREANAYVHSKLLSEQVARSFVGLGLPVVIVNPAFPFGARDHRPTPTGRIVLDQLALEPSVYFDGALCAVDVRDVARWHRLAEERGRPGERYILGTENLTMRELGMRVARIAGGAEPARHMPLRVQEALVHFDTWLSERAGGSPVGTPETLALAVSGFVFDTRKTHRELGAPQFTVDEAFASAIDWFRQTGRVEKARRRLRLQRLILSGRR